MKDLVYTPISKTYKKKGDPDSRKDFEEQEKLTKQGNTWMWDADRKNKAKISCGCRVRDRKFRKK